jgi:hypothetical protein
VHRSDLDDYLNRHRTPAQQRRELLGDEIISYLDEQAEHDPPLTEAQKDVVRGAFRDGG